MRSETTFKVLPETFLRRPFEGPELFGTDEAEMDGAMADIFRTYFPVDTLLAEAVAKEAAIRANAGLSEQGRSDELRKLNDAVKSAAAKEMPKVVARGDA